MSLGPLLVDGDIVVYTAGHADKARTWVVYDSEGNEVAKFPKAKEADAYIDAQDETYKFAKMLHEDVPPLSHTLNNVRNMLENLRREVPHDRMYIYLTGETNFRTALATAREYKGNRRKTARPYYYDEIREYLIATWGAKIKEPFEADDLISIHAHHLMSNQPDKEYVICSIDKDLYQIPGRHYHLRDKTYRVVSSAEARRNLYIQILSGDPSDNIPGLPRVGEKTAAKWLDSTPPEKWSELVIEKYKEAFGSDGGLKMSEETAKLVYILKSTDELEMVQNRIIHV